EHQVAAGHVVHDAVAGEAAHAAGGGDSGGARAGGQRDTRATLPDPMVYFAFVQHLDNLEVGPAREEWVVLDKRADALQRKVVRVVVDVVDGVRVADADEREPEIHPIDGDRQV